MHLLVALRDVAVGVDPDAHVADLLCARGAGLMDTNIDGESELLGFGLQAEDEGGGGNGLAEG